MELTSVDDPPPLNHDAAEMPQFREFFQVIVGHVLPAYKLVVHIVHVNVHRAFHRPRYPRHQTNQH